ncbi:AMP-binding protein [Streptacidiphilus sp. P02-A3a]|nr:AMP-binding protein [Streptacidiphilus sp. P02-A3a]
MLSHRELRGSIPRLRAHLSRASGKALVLLSGCTCVDLVAAYLAVLEAGHAVLFAAPDLDRGQQDRLARTFQPDLLVKVAQAHSPSRTDPPRGYRHLFDEGALSVWGGAPREHPAIHDDLALVLLTSGSIGEPQGVRLSYANLMSNAKSISESLGITPADRAITSLPLHYSYGLSVLNSHLFSGASIVLAADSPTSRNFWRTFSSCGATTFAGVPLAYSALLRTLSRSWPQLLRTATQAGGPMPVELVRRYSGLAQENGARFVVMYGQTEATARISCLDTVAEPEYIGSVGTAVPGGRLRIDPSEAGSIGGADGEVVYEGPNVMMGYATGRGDLATGDSLRGTLRTGDLGSIRDGRLYLTGRLKRVCKIASRRVSLDEFQDALTAQYGAAAVELGGVITLFHTGPDSPSLQAEVRRACDAFGISTAYVRLQDLAALPRTSAGKVDYQALTLATHQDPEYHGQAGETRVPL